jgi:hypothetical protein
MAFDQAYYTSCEQGLSNRSGYQFNAATPGIPPDVLADVEALTSYSPPSSLPYTATEEEIARSPVNLCYQPGRTVILANVVFLGNDFSRRFGNYFAHALLAADIDGELGSTLPIEYWQAPFWVHTSVSDKVLPSLSVPVSGGGLLTRASVAGFVGNHRCQERIAALVTAVGHAVARRERKVVIVEQTSDAAANWIGAACFLLPAELVRGMSFATYENEPRYSPHTVVGTVPDVGFDVDETALASNYVFDMTTDRASDLTVHPLGELLADIGVESATEAWSRAAQFAVGTELGLDDWHPVLAASVLGTGLGYAEDAVAVAGWLGSHAARLGTGAVAEIGARALPLLAGADDPIAPLAALAAAARTVGAHELAEDVEMAQVEAMLEPGGRITDDGEPIRSPKVRSVASAALGERLRLATAPDVVALLNWAARSGVHAEQDAVRAAGARVIGPAVLVGTPDKQLLAVLEVWPALCAGVVDHLAAASSERLDPIVAVLTGPVGQLLDVGNRPELRAPAAVAQVRLGEVTAADAFVRLAGEHGTLLPDILDVLWPKDDWSAEEAHDIVLHLDPAILIERVIVDRLSRVLRAGEAAGPDEPTEGLDRLCGVIATSPVYSQLPVTLAKSVHRRRDILLLVENLLRAPRRQYYQLLEELCDAFGGYRQDKRVAVSRKLVEQSDRLDTLQLALLLARIRPVRDTYLLTLQGEPGAEVAITMMSRLLGALGELKRLHGTHKHLRKPHVDMELSTIAILQGWRRRDLRRVEELLDRNGDEYMAWWLHDWQRKKAGGLAKLAFGRRTPPPPNH